MCHWSRNAGRIQADEYKFSFFPDAVKYSPSLFRSEDFRDTLAYIFVVYH